MFDIKTVIKGLLFVSLVACSGRGNGSSVSVLADTSAARVAASLDTVPSGARADGYVRRLDTLTRGEEAFLKKLAGQDENLIWTNQVERILDKDSSVVLSRLVFPANFLLDSGYRDFELSGRGLLTDANITYYFDRGQADNGYGSVVGYDTATFTHTVFQCGTGMCITEVFNARKKIAEIDKKVTLIDKP